MEAGMSNRVWLLFSVGLLLSGGVWLLSRGAHGPAADDPTSPTPQSTPSGAASTQQTGDSDPVDAYVTAPAVEAAPSQGDETQEKESGALVFPTIEKVREEVAANPHATPPSLIQFARDLAPRMEEALQSRDPRVVKKMVFALKACALSSSEQALPQAQAVCAANWRRIAEARKDDLPEIGEEYRSSTSRFGGEVVRLLDASQKILQSGN
jgi:hypothetical protein